MPWKDFIRAAVVYAILLVGPAFSTGYTNKTRCNPQGTVYNFTLPNLLESRNVSLGEFYGKALLVVNVATYCGYTWQYPQLNALQDKYSESIAVLGFPCNQFGMQEPGGSASEILNGIQHVRPGNGFQLSFLLFKKGDVNGAKEDPLYTMLKNSCPSIKQEFQPVSKLFYEPMRNTDIRWNFEKFLIDRNGVPVYRYDASVQPDEIESDVKDVLNGRYDQVQYLRRRVDGGYFEQIN